MSTLWGYADANGIMDSVYNLRREDYPHRSEYVLKSDTGYAIYSDLSFTKPGMLRILFHLLWAWGRQCLAQLNRIRTIQSENTSWPRESWISLLEAADQEWTGGRSVTQTSKSGHNTNMHKYECSSSQSRVTRTTLIHGTSFPLVFSLWCPWITWDEKEFLHI